LGSVVGVVVGGVEMEISVVLLAFGGGAECCVGFGDLDEAFRGVWVGGVVVWVVPLGEGIEGP
jgi:hypothetical protein